MNIREIYPDYVSAGSCRRSGGSTSLPPEHSRAGKENALQRVREILNHDRETVLIDGPISSELRRGWISPMLKEEPVLRKNWTSSRPVP